MYKLTNIGEYIMNTININHKGYILTLLVLEYIDADKAVCFAQGRLALCGLNKEGWEIVRSVDINEALLTYQVE